MVEFGSVTERDQVGMFRERERERERERGVRGGHLKMGMWKWVSKSENGYLELGFGNQEMGIWYSQERHQFHDCWKLGFKNVLLKMDSC